VNIENTRKRDPAQHLAGMVTHGTSEYIERMEQAGGRQMVASDLLPVEILHAGERPVAVKAFQALGFVFGQPVEGDDLFVHATLPPGWQRKPGENRYGYWTSIVDERGIERVAIFYKAAFYDRHAHMSLLHVGSNLASQAVYDEAGKETIPWAVLTAAERDEACTSLHEMLASARRAPDIYGKYAPRVRALLREVAK